MIYGYNEPVQLTHHEPPEAPLCCPDCGAATKEVDLARDPSIHKRVCPRCGWASELYRLWRPR